MLDQTTTQKIKELTEEFFKKMTAEDLTIDVGFVDAKKEDTRESQSMGAKGVIKLKINLQEPQILIGQQGQTLFEIQRLLRIILNKKLKEAYYLDLDINEYKQNKIEYLEALAQNLADEVSQTKQEKSLPPMSSYERRIIHAKLAGRDDIVTESRGDGQDRHLVIKPK